MTDKDYDKLKQIEEAIQAFNRNKLYESSLALYSALGYTSNKTERISPATFDGFMESFNLSKNAINREKALVNEWKQIEFIFQVADNELNSGITSQIEFVFEPPKFNSNEYNSFIFFTIQLKEESYKRSELVKITRELNVPFKMPVMVLFQYGNKLTLSIIDRRLHKKDTSKDVLEKVTLIKDIDITNPQRAHKEILKDLSLNELYKKFEFHSFVKLHEAWKATLNISELNKKFFKDLANWYFWAMENVSFPDDLEKKKEVRNATNLIRLITRVVFIWFIKEKSLVPNALFNEAHLGKILKDFNKDSKSQNYYHAILQNLFFGTLNQKMDERKFAKDDGTIKTNSEEYGVKNLFRYADLFAISESDAMQLFKDVPFLNGGLFDCLDKPNEEGKIVYVDGFSRNPKQQAVVPDHLFFGEEREVDLNDIFATKNKKYKTRGLINLLESYKFTVAENTPIEEEIALDPELLGKVFENLLASYNPETQSTARKQTGSFYTPREIVNYMVDESLLEYIKQNVKNESKNFESRLRELISYAETPNPFDEQETKALIEGINNCKILDPACGSGAYPMGILHKMVHLLQKLDPENKHWKALQRQKAMEETEAAFNIGDKEERGKRLAEINDVFENNASDYGRKLYLIENCIYGIDIQPIAVQISKLRFFISLIIDQNKQATKENFGIRSLPNLETKFVAANTLIGLDIPTNDLFAESNPIKKIENELKSVRHEYFAASNRKEKLRLQKEDKKLRKHISELIKEQLIKKGNSEVIELKQLIQDEKGNLKQLEKSKEDYEIINTTDIFGAITQTKIDKKAKKIKAQKDRINNFEKELQIKELATNKDAIANVAEQIASFDPYDQNTFAPWFDPEWMFGLTTGFDIVIGNPPYVQLQKLGIVADVLQSKGFETFARTGDIYMLFFEKGQMLLKPKGNLVFITGSAWLRSNYGKSLRNFFLKNANGKILIDLSDADVFESATVLTTIFLLTKEKNKNELKALRITKKNQYLINNLAANFKLYHTIIKSLDENAWVITDTNKQQLKQKIGIQGKKLKDWNIEINRGIVTGLNEAFVIDDFAKNELIKNDPKSIEIIKPLLRGRDLGRFTFNDTKLWLIGTFPTLNLNIINYPAIKNHLLSFGKTKLDQTGEKGARKKTNNEWFETQDQIGYWSNFEKPKIIYPNMVKDLSFTFDDEGYYTNQKCFILTGTYLHYLLGVFNSTLFRYCFEDEFPELQGNSRELNKVVFDQIPIKEVDLKTDFDFKNITNIVILLKKQNQDTTFFERLIDAMVYELYLPEEIKAGGAEVLKHLTNLPELKKGEDEKNLKTIEKVYKELSDPKHPIGVALLKLLTIEEVNIIEGRK